METPPSHSETAAALRSARRLLAISVKLNTTQQPEALLEYIICTATDVLDVEAAALLLFDKDGECLRFAASTGSDPDQLSQIAVPLGKSLAGTIFSSNRPLVNNNVTQDPRHFKQVDAKVQFETRSLLGVPMRIAGKPIGVLEVLNKRSGDFHRDDVETLMIIAEQAAVAIRNARQVEALERANRDLQQLDMLKSNVLSIASHELRTPLSILMFNLALLKEELQDPDNELVAMAEEAGHRLADIMGTMMDMNALRGRVVSLQRQPVSLQDLLNKAWRDAQVFIEEKGHQFGLDLPSEPLIVDVDVERIAVVFANVVKNAITFTPEGGNIVVRAKRVGKEVQVTVQDNGIGITQAEAEDVFKAFYQTEDVLTRENGGLGLGLTIAREVMQLHGGRIWAENTDTGSTIYIQLAVYQPHFAQSQKTVPVQHVA